MSLSRACLPVSHLRFGVQAVSGAPCRAQGAVRCGPAGARAPSRSLFGRVSGQSQSKVLSSPEDGIVEMQVLHVKPEYMEDYLKLATEHIPRVVQREDIPVSLIGAWTTRFGQSTNIATHLWEYKSYDCVSEASEKLQGDKLWHEFVREQGRFTSASSSELILPFTFFQASSLQGSGRIYELRSYRIKPGAMIEWGLEWSKGVQYRQDEVVGGWFSQIGRQHSVYHLWAYKSLQDRNDTRKDAWKFPGWDECVRRTVPLIREHESSILLPTPYSPLQ